jgi:hypothetical protein
MYFAISVRNLAPHYKNSLTFLIPFIEVSSVISTNSRLGLSLNLRLCRFEFLSILCPIRELTLQCKIISENSF